MKVDIGLRRNGYEGSSHNSCWVVRISCRTPDSEYCIRLCEITLLVVFLFPGTAQSAVALDAFWEMMMIQSY